MRFLVKAITWLRFIEMKARDGFLLSISGNRALLFVVEENDEGSEEGKCWKLNIKR